MFTRPLPGQGEVLVGGTKVALALLDEAAQVSRRPPAIVMLFDDDAFALLGIAAKGISA